MVYRWWRLVLIGVGLLYGLSACGSTAKTPVTPVTVTATMTATPAVPGACLPYGSYIRDTPTPQPTIDPARSRWMSTQLPVTATPTRDPQLPTVTATPTATPIPPTCSRRPEQPTLTSTPTPRPTVPPAITQPPPLFGGGGHTLPQNLSAQLGFDYLGAVVVDRDGRGHAVWGWWAEDFWNEGRSYYMGTDVWGGWHYRSGLARNCAKNKGSPAIAVGPDGRTLYVAYGDGLGDQVRVYVRASTDRGASWSVPEAVTAPPAAYPAIQVDSTGQVHVLYRAMACSGDPDDEDTVCTFHQEHVVGRPGQGWSGPTRVLAKGGNQIHSDLLSTALPDGTSRTFAIVAVQFEGVFVAYRDAEGNWSPAQVLSYTPDRSPQNIQSIAFDYAAQRYVYTCWEIYAQSGFSCAWTADGGASWSYQLVVPPLDGGGAFHISSPAPLYDIFTGRLWLLYTHVVWSPRRGYIGIMGVTPGETDWFPQVPGADEVAVLETACQEPRIVTVGYRDGALRVFPVLWQEHCPENAGALEIYGAFVVPSQFLNLWK